LEEGFLKFKAEKEGFEEYTDFLSSLLYPKVFDNFYHHWLSYGDVSKIPTKAFFYGLKRGEEITVSIAIGKNIIIEYLNTGKADENGDRMVMFRINGDIRTVKVNDKALTATVSKAVKAQLPNEIGSPLQGSLSQILIQEGDAVKEGQPLFIIEAMKMENTVTAPMAGIIKKIYLGEKL